MFDLAFLGYPFGAWLLLSISSRGRECSMPARQRVIATTDLPTFSSTFHQPIICPWHEPPSLFVAGRQPLGCYELSGRRSADSTAGRSHAFTPVIPARGGEMPFKDRIFFSHLRQSDCMCCRGEAWRSLGEKTCIRKSDYQSRFVLLLINVYFCNTKAIPVVSNLGT